ncbi:uncharacterized protein LOC112173888 isoform X2 [Rosa chinensis]|uniref:uncharacterized protein LOC112173888 isoform X2 n=1 Tax=Rosa chinensis TaxID=74649 RepID=UPI000D09432B|nr:uncharacterized protein LOC112173888 isoform X2 [Rosa chinensis]
MADFTKELKPLFDYNCVQPLNVISFDDDDEDEVSASPPTKKRKKASNSVVEKVDDSVKFGSCLIRQESSASPCWIRQCKGLRLATCIQDSGVKEIKPKRSTIMGKTKKGYQA